MNLKYTLRIENPENHQAKIRISGQKCTSDHKVEVFMPTWCPGSYLIREYSRNIRNFIAKDGRGQIIHFEQVKKNTWVIDWDKSDGKLDDTFEISYEVFCHELTVRTSHIDTSHAFIHGPSVFMGVTGNLDEKIELEVFFSPLWSKISTGLKDISDKREEFIYEARNYDDFIDCPLEIGSQETDGFRVDGKDHELAFYGEFFPHKENIKSDIKKIVEYVSSLFGGTPYDRYLFITHLVPGLFGGLEHKNSTALQFSPLALQKRSRYIQWLALVAHEYFHTWNVKRIRPKSLGPFNYHVEADTSLMWLSEGLTSFVDELFVYRSELCTIEEYLTMQKENLNRYLSIPGKKFHSVEESGRNAWIKLYRPDENSNNSSISYYLTGGICFFILNILLKEKKKDVNDLLKLLWKSYEGRPEVGLVSEEVFDMVKQVGGAEIRDIFEGLICNREEYDFEKYLNKAGIDIEYENPDTAYLGMTSEFEGQNIKVAQVVLDGPAYKSGLNAQDEIIAINGIRMCKDEFEKRSEFLAVDTKYIFTVSRLNRLINIDVVTGKVPKKILNLVVKDRKKVLSFFKD